MLFESPDPNEQFRSRRRQARRRLRLRRTTALVVLVLAAAAVALGARIAGDVTTGKKSEVVPQRKPAPKAAPRQRPLPAEVRGVHVTMPLASVPGKLQEYLDIPGLNALEVDVKDENGEVGFVRGAPKLARVIGAAKPYYNARRLAAQAHRHGVYLIGRVVVFEDPLLSEKWPGLAIKTSSGEVWRNDAGLGWVNPYDRRVWNYNLAVATAAAKAGFDEIQFDYVRFPSDGDVENAVYRGRLPEAKHWTITRFVHYVSKRLRPLGARVSLDLFGLSATRDLGIGQSPRRLGPYVDAIYPMVYPSHYGSGEHGLDDPNANPGLTVSRSLLDFRRQLRGRKAKLIPWLEDFTLGGTARTPAEVRAQIEAARNSGVGGFLLWNPSGEYTEEVLHAGPSG